MENLAGKAGRILELDALRGIAVVLMVIYHIIFDIYYFGIARIDLFSPPLVLFQRVIGSSFLLIAGISLVLSESRNRAGYRKHLARALKLGAVAAAITLATWIYPHEGVITFGIIHLIAASTLIAPFFFRFGKINLLMGLLLIGAGLYTSTIKVEQQYLFWLGLSYPGYRALDYYPLLPWFGIVLIGLEAGRWLLDNAPWERFAWLGGIGPLEWIGKNSLLIYLIHQPIIIGLLWLMGFVRI
jgi:uncharacterized membrane protein